MLIGSGEFSFGQTEEFDRFLLERMPPSRRRMRFLPTASGSMEYARHFGEYIRGLDADVEFMSIPVYRARDARREKNLALIRGSGVVYLGGGLSTTAAEVLGQPPLIEALREVIADGGVVAAIGGAASALGSVCGDRNAVSAGMDFIAGCAIVAPFDPSDDQDLRALASQPTVTLGVGVPALTAVAIGPGGNASIMGDGSIAVVRKPADATREQS